MAADQDERVQKVEIVLAAEKAHLRRIRGWRFEGEGAEGTMLFGFAVSGGGIRSAAFALGAMHALVRYDKLRWFDYLSTVSGGGYAGSALTWMLSTHKDSDVRPNTSAKLGGFPLSGWRQGRRASANVPPPKFDRAPERRLDWIRARANYLTPSDELGRLIEAREENRKLDAARAPRDEAGARPSRPKLPPSPLPPGGLGILSVVSVVLRSVIVGLGVYLPALFALMMLVGAATELVHPRLDWLYALAGGRWWADALRQLPWAAVFAGIGIFGLELFVVACMLYALLSRLGGVKSYWLRTRVQWGGGWVLTVAFICTAMATLPLAISWAQSLWIGSGLTAAGILAGASRLVLRNLQVGGKKTRWSIDTISVFGGLALCYGLLLLGYVFANFALGLEGRDAVFDRYGQLTERPWLLWLGLVAWSAIGGLVMNLNHLTPHRMYRDRLMEAFLPPPVHPWPAFKGVKPDTGYLRDMCGAGLGNGVYAGPFHLINANVVLTRSQFEGLRGRGGDSFVLSPLYCGSAATRWYPTKGYGAATRFAFNRRTMTLATAMSISGAAANPNAGASGRGPTRSWPVAFLMNMLHLRLGYLEVNPDRIDEFSRGLKRWLVPSRPNPWVPGVAHLFGLGLHEQAPFVELTDGGHFENLALYELLRREVRVILCTDAGCDPGFAFADLSNAIERARVDFGVHVSFIGSRPVSDLVLPPLAPDQNPFTAPQAARSFAIARIRYAPARRVPPDANEPIEELARGDRDGILIYIKSTMTGGLPADLYGYRGANPAFPHESTSDQNFDETQFESYRELGYRLTSAALFDPLVARIFGGDGENPPAAARDGPAQIKLATGG